VLQASRRGQLLWRVCVVFLGFLWMLVPTVADRLSGTRTADCPTRLTSMTELAASRVSKPAGVVRTRIRAQAAIVKRAVTGRYKLLSAHEREDQNCEKTDLDGHEPAPP